MNSCLFTGNVAKDVELRYTANGTAQAQFSIGVNGGRKKPDGTWEDNTEWVNCVLWAEKAERQAPMLLKGTPVLVQGRLQTRSWESDGQKHYRTELIVDRCEIFGRRPKQEGNTPFGAANTSTGEIEDLPFE